jgi:hypothetical protein
MVSIKSIIDWIDLKTAQSSSAFSILTSAVIDSRQRSSPLSSVLSWCRSKSAIRNDAVSAANVAHITTLVTASPCVVRSTSVQPSAPRVRTELNVSPMK